ncbi:D-amino acid dehydrogenase [Acidisoma cellulosilytica]|uniref:D-amino acid dehydrogenase n=1 Tax=Acidisoma cellulosilyticum TaxID=2802395 RepID=A0A963Z6Z8_9PROT|nr:D-amino acid dehydrogenase [Acidisoma cellulosilyticum]MCB8883738.1 D-amino acid dehydrogenase [Acidisoma cellulosilyticum]
MPHIAVIGAGITGMTTAYALLNRGHKVTVIERHPYPAMETSFANGGQLSVSNAEVWNHASTVIKGLKWMTRKDAPLLVHPAPTWHKASWMAEFVGQIPRYHVNTVETVRLALTARKYMLEIAEKEHIDFNLERRGILHFYYNKASFEHAGVVSQMLKEGGLDRHPVTQAEIKDIEPALNGQFYGGYFTPSDSTGDIHKFTRGLADVCARLGMNFVGNAEVVRITHLGGQGIEIAWQKKGPGESTAQSLGRFDSVVMCAGVGTRRLAAMLGDRVNIYPVKGYSITVHLDSETSRKAVPWVSLLDDKAKIVTSRLGEDRFRVAGTAEFRGENRDIRADRIQPLVAWCRKLFPRMDTDRVIPWAGLRPMMPNMLPRVAKGRQERVFYNSGHGHLGWTLSAATAEIIAQQITSETPA